MSLFTQTDIEAFGVYNSAMLDSLHYRAACCEAAIEQLGRMDGETARTLATAARVQLAKAHQAIADIEAQFETVRAAGPGDGGAE